MPEPQYLYLTTTGWKSGKPHEIEIWFVVHEGRYYLCAEHGMRAHWVQNIQHHQAVVFRVGNRQQAPPITGHARIVLPSSDPLLVGAVKAKLDEKYGWSAGLLVELAAG